MPAFFSCASVNVSCFTKDVLSFLEQQPDNMTVNAHITKILIIFMIIFLCNFI